MKGPHRRGACPQGYCAVLSGVCTQQHPAEAAHGGSEELRTTPAGSDCPCRHPGQDNLCHHCSLETVRPSFMLLGADGQVCPLLKVRLQTGHPQPSGTSDFQMKPAGFFHPVGLCSPQQGPWLPLFLKTAGPGLFLMDFKSIPQLQAHDRACVWSTSLPRAHDRGLPVQLTGISK